MIAHCLFEQSWTFKLKEDVETVKQKMCDSYCKYPENWDLKSMGSLSESEICQNCPLNNL